MEIIFEGNGLPRVHWRNNFATYMPSLSLTLTPTKAPTLSPTKRPSPEPTSKPTASPTPDVTDTYFCGADQNDASSSCRQRAVAGSETSIYEDGDTCCGVLACATGSNFMTELPTPNPSTMPQPTPAAYFRDKRFPILKYRTTELVLLSSSISGCGHKVSIRNTTFLISGTTTNNRHCIFPLGFFIETGRIMHTQSTCLRSAFI